MVHPVGADGQRARAELLVIGKLLIISHSLPFQVRTQPERKMDLRFRESFGNPLQRPHIHMIPVPVGDQDQVHGRKVLDRERGGIIAFSEIDHFVEIRIDQDMDAVKIKEHGGMADVIRVRVIGLFRAGGKAVPVKSDADKKKKTDQIIKHAVSVTPRGAGPSGPGSP